MASQNQIEANRSNAEMSTGPTTEEGKLVVSTNAVTHGLLSKEALLPNEDASCLEGLRRQLDLALEPANEMESILVERIVSLTWRLKRAGRIEAALFVIEQNKKKVSAANAEVNKYVENRFASILAGLDKSGSDKITDPKNYKIAKAKLDAADAEADGELPSLGQGFVKSMIFIDRLQRYETAMERSLYKALHELQRVQAMRLGMNVTLPLAVDVHGDGKEL